jgi:hypothetical protein
MLLGLVLLFGITASMEAARPDEPKADFVVDAVAWSKEYVEDKKAFKEKYQGKVIEVTGKVWLPREGLLPDLLPDVMVEGYKKPGDRLGIMLVCTPSKEEATKHQGLRALAKGQTVTFRAKSLRGDLGLERCTFVKVGPCTATPFTVARLQKALADPTSKKKYMGTDAVVRGQVVELKVTDSFVRWVISDPMKKGGAKVDAQITTNAKHLREEYAKTKVGDTIVLIGEIDSNGLWDARLLKAPPEGVKLPGDKK